MRTLTGLVAMTRPLIRPVVVIGMFDGVHVGHQRLIRTAVRLAARRRGTSVAMTFHPDPQRLLQPHASPDALMPLNERLQLIAALGVQVAWVIPFTRRFSAYSAEAFLERVLRRRVRPTAVVVGSNFSFGKGRRGDIELLRRFGARQGARIVVVPPVARDGGLVSSSRIRRAVQRGDMPAAARLLGRPFTLHGRVEHGAGRGRRLGFPTANVTACAECLPARGVYRVRVRIGRAWRPGVMNIGVRPTFRRAGAPARPTALPICEVYLPAFRGTLYGRRMTVQLLARLRGERRFSSPVALVRQIRRDLARAEFSS